MIKRVRNFKDQHIISHITYHGHLDHKCDSLDIKQWMKSNEEYMKSPADWFICFDYNEKGILEHKPNLYFNLFCRHKQQPTNKHHGFLSWYIGLCHENKCKVNISESLPEKIPIKNEHKEN